MKNQVALLAEGVDRNHVFFPRIRVASGSPSSRRAWIEIGDLQAGAPSERSPSSRRAWIEISRSPATMAASLSPSSRRAWIEIRIAAWNRPAGSRRPPRGGRG